jgi:hypothetical protein
MKKMKWAAVLAGAVAFANVFVRADAVAEPTESTNGVLVVRVMKDSKRVGELATALPNVSVMVIPLPDGAPLTVKTDAHGEARFERLSWVSHEPYRDADIVVHGKVVATVTLWEYALWEVRLP